MVINIQLQIGSKIVPDYDGLRVSKKISDTESTSTFSVSLPNRYGQNVGSYTMGDGVEIRAQQGTGSPIPVLFTGILESINYPSAPNGETIELSGRDYTSRLMDTNILPVVYTNLPVGSIVKAVVASYADGITTNNVAGSINGTGGNIPIIDRIAFNQTPVYDAIKTLADIAQYIFYVDNGSDLHFEEAETTNSNLTFNSTNVYDANISERRDTIFNEIWVYGDKYRDTHQEEFTANGTGSVFTLSYKPHSTSVDVGSPLTVSTHKKGGIFGMNIAPPSGTNYLVDYHGKQIVFISGTDFGVIPANNDLVTIVYDRDLTIAKTGRNSSSIAQYGRRMKKIVDTSIKDADTAQQLVTAELDEYSQPKKEADLRIKGVLDVTPGQLATVNLPQQNVSGQTYEIISADYDFSKENNYAEKVLSLKLNKNIKDISDTIKDLYKRLHDVESQGVTDSLILTRLEFATGSIGIRQSGAIVYTRGITGSTLLLYGPDVGGNLSLGSRFLASGTNEGYMGLSDWEVRWSGGYF